MQNTVRLKKAIITSIMSALSIVLYVVGPKFPLPSLFPSFLELNFSLLPIVILTLFLGFKEGFCAILIRFIFKLAFGSSTAAIGETSDLIIGFVVVSILSISKVKLDNKLKDIPIFLILILAFILGGVLSNIFALPMYINVMGFTSESFASMLNQIFKNCTVDNFIFYYFIGAIVPFNLLLGSIISLISYLVWIPLKKYCITYFIK